MGVWTRRGGLVLAAVGLLGLLAGLGPPAVSADGPSVVTTLAAHPTFYRGMFHDRAGQHYVRLPEIAAVFGTLAEADGTLVPGATLRLERRLFSEEVFTEVAESITSEEGSGFLSDPLAGNADYRVVFDGDATRLPSTSAAMPLTTERDLNGDLVVRGTRERPRPVLRGTVRPAWGGREVRLERKRCADSCDFRTVATTTTGPAGHWRLRASIPERGHLWTYRAALDAEGDFAASTSVHLRTFKPPHRPGVARLRGLK